MLARTLTAFLSITVKHPHYRFCAKRDILKTYLEIIPPHRVYELVQQKDKTLQTALANLERLDPAEGAAMEESDLRTVLKEVKKRSSMISMPVLTRIAELACRHKDSPQAPELRKAYTKIIRVAKSKTEKVHIQELVEMVYKLVKAGEKEYDLMKQVERVIIEDPVPLNYPYIRKILYAYTHLNVGSAVLYSHVSRTLTLGQHQLRAVDLAEAAYMLSKVSENAKGGYGVFALAQKHIENSIPRLGFTDLVRASSYLLTQNIGSNRFQVRLESALYNTYPSKDRLRINDFVALLKATSSYYFKFKEGALLSMLKTSTLRMAAFASLQQFEDIVWAWGRIGKGDEETWKCLEEQVMRHLLVLKPRQLAFIYHSLSSSFHPSGAVFKAIEDKFTSLKLQEINQHYLIKFLLGMQRRKMYDEQVFVTVSGVISRRIDTLSNHEFMAFLKIMNESDLDFESKEKMKDIIGAMQRMATQIQKRLYLLKMTEITELLYLFVKLQLESGGVAERCMATLSNVIDIPKSAFIKAFFSFTIKQNYSKAVEFIPILEELTKYGPLGYFFSPHLFPLLAYSLFHFAVRGQNVRINRELLRHTSSALKDINPIILNKFVRKAYDQALSLVEEYDNLPRQ